MPEIILVACPECGAPASVADSVLMESTDGPVEHYKISCVQEHFFFMPSASLSPL